MTDMPQPQHPLLGPDVLRGYFGSEIPVQVASFLLDADTQTLPLDQVHEILQQKATEWRAEKIKMSHTTMTRLSALIREISPDVSANALVFLNQQIDIALDMLARDAHERTL